MNPYAFQISFTKLSLAVLALNGITAFFVRRRVRKNTEEQYKRYLTYLLAHMTHEELEVVKLDLMYMKSDD